MMHGYDWAGQSLAGWIASEKMDGCRAYWDGQQLRTKGGRLYRNIPAPMLQALQRVGVPLDCELWAGRAAGLEPARMAAQCARWAPALALWVFDLPEHGGRFSERLAALRALPECDALRVAPHWTPSDPFADRDALQALRGEGLMLRDPRGHYRPGRRDCLLKLK